MKQTVNVFDYAGHICKAMEKGILLTTKSGDELNTMTIGWGMLGIEWGKPIFIALVRESRHTRKLLDESMEFTVNIPVGEFDTKILGFCGRNSGRDTNKFEALGLTIEQGNLVSAPGIVQLPLTLECKVLYRQKQDLSLLPQGVVNYYYPQEIDGLNPGKNRDYHIAYYGEVLDAYIVK